ncbi:MAG TPA: RagB/SusD family nutrient uptake outer membrane protein [Gemmatimonadaceae bacterium]|nr:RagB/SusD family nutrient uptake outer membrane protein [Gemmatimonadaceae bacterium]
MKITSKNSLLRSSALVILASAALYGCKDFLNNAAEPQGTLNASTLATKSGVEGSLVAAYRTLDCTNATSSDWGCAVSNWVFGSVASDDSYKGSDGLDQPEINDIEGYHWGTTEAARYLNTKWTQVYEGVVRANSTIRLLKQVVASSPTEISVVDQHGIEGEAIFLRAHYHFEAYRMWGNIPYYREDDTDFRKANEDTTAVIADIIKDLDDAIALLPTTPRNGQKGRATAWTAKAYKGRVQMYDHQYANAVTTFTDVVNNGPYKLETSFDKVWSAFAANQNGPETIFAYQASAQDGEPNAANANYGERLNFPYAPSHFQCCGFDPPSVNLVNFYKVDAAGLPLALSSPTTWNIAPANALSNFVGGDLSSAVDPRLDWTVGREGVPFKDWGLYHITWVRDQANGGPYMPKKVIHERASGQEATVGWQPQQQSSINIHIFRYADLLLMLAEADVETNNLAGALAIVNQIRARAGVAAQGCAATADVATTYPQCTGDTRLAVPINDPSITWAVYRVGLYGSFPSQAYAREAVRMERRLELAMEGQRLFDLRRYGMTYAKAVLNGYLTGAGPAPWGSNGGREDTRRTYKTSAEAVADRHRLYAIPQEQIDLSKVGSENRLTQNAGW